jgi:hypothetical protein
MPRRNKIEPRPQSPHWRRCKRTYLLDERDIFIPPNWTFRNPRLWFEATLWNDIRAGMSSSASRETLLALGAYCKASSKRVFEYVRQNPALVLRIGLERYGKQGDWLALFMWLERELANGNEIVMPPEPEDLF